MEFITCTVPSGGDPGDGVGGVASSSFVILGGEGPDDFPNFFLGSFFLQKLRVML
jgi:hypothetical protein